MCSASPQGWLMVDGCTDHHFLHVIILLCPQLSRHVLEKRLFLYIFYEKGAEVPGSSCCTRYTLCFALGALTAPAALRRMQVPEFCSNVKRREWYFLQQHMVCVST